MQTVAVNAAPQGFGATDLIQIALCLFLLVASAQYALRKLGDSPGASFSVRVLMPALVIAASFTALSLVNGLGSGDEAFLQALFTLFAIGLLSLVFILVVELIAWRLRPIRTGAWIGWAFLLYIGCFLIAPLLLVAALMSPTTAGQFLHWRSLHVIVIISTGALLWWSCLPPDDPRSARVFE